MSETAYCLTCWWHKGELISHTTACVYAVKHLEKNSGHEVRVTEFTKEKLINTERKPIEKVARRVYQQHFEDCDCLICEFFDLEKLDAEDGTKL